MPKLDVSIRLQAKTDKESTSFWEMSGIVYQTVKEACEEQGWEVDDDRVSINAHYG